MTMDLSIIIVNYKTKKITADCLRSIKASSDTISKEIIVVDNGSEDGSIEYLKKSFPWTKVYSSGGNLGFARGNNFGVNKAKGKYVWLLNSDTVINKSTIQTLFDLAMENNSKIASCRLKNKDQTIQPQGGYLPRLSKLAAWMWFIDDLPIINKIIKPYQQRNLDFFKADQHPGWLGGTALLIKRDLYQKMNGLDKKIFMYGEDVEFCLRASHLKIKLDYFHKPSLVHLGQASGSSRGAVLGEYKGLKYIYQKHYSIYKTIALRSLLLTGAFLRIIIFGIVLRDNTRKTIYAEAFKLA
jgi:GT2 family glycosyltransferase